MAASCGVSCNEKCCIGASQGAASASDGRSPPFYINSLRINGHFPPFYGKSPPFRGNYLRSRENKRRYGDVVSAETYNGLRGDCFRSACRPETFCV